VRFEATIPSGELTARDIEIASGPIRLTFRCEVQTEAGRLHVRGTAPGAGFVLNASTSERNGGIHVEGDLHVSGTLAGLGQRELALHARRLVSAFAGVP
jgi:hypothetical protein